MLVVKYGFIDHKFKQAVPALYDQAESFRKGLASVMLGGKWGMIDKAGTCRLPLQFDDMNPYAPYLCENGLIKAHDSSGHYIFSKAGKLLKKFDFHELWLFDSDTAVFGDNDKYGLIGQDLSILLPPTYKQMMCSFEGLRSFEDDQLWGYLDNRGKIAISPRFCTPGPHVKGLAPVSIKKAEGGERHGYIDITGNFVIPPVFSQNSAFWTDLAMVEQDEDGRVGFIDISGKFVVPNVYDDARGFYSGFAAVNIGGVSEFQRLREGLSRCNKKLDEMHELHQKLIIKLEQELQKGLMKNELSPEEQVIEESNHRLARESRNIFPNSRHQNGSETGRTGRWGHINKKNEIIVPIEYQKVGDFSEGMVFVCDGEAFGYYDSEGKFKIPAVFEDAGNFKNDRARVKIDGLWGFINSEGKWLVQPVYQDAMDFDNGLALVQFDGKWGMIDTNGKEAVPPEYDYLENYSDGMAKMGRT